MIEDLNICCLWYLKSTVSTLYLILEKCRFFIPGFQVTDFEFLQAKGLCGFFFLNRLLINFAWSTKLFPPSFFQIHVTYHLSIAKCLTLQAYMQIVTPCTSVSSLKRLNARLGTSCIECSNLRWFFSCQNHPSHRSTKMKTHNGKPFIHAKSSYLLILQQNQNENSRVKWQHRNEN